MEDEFREGRRLLREEPPVNEKKGFVAGDVGA
jgi:hypothetical protein